MHLICWVMETFANIYNCSKIYSLPLAYSFHSSNAKLLAMESWQLVLGRLKCMEFSFSVPSFFKIKGLTCFQSPNIMLLSMTIEYKSLISFILICILQVNTLMTHLRKIFRASLLCTKFLLWLIRRFWLFCLFSWFGNSSSWEKSPLRKICRSSSVHFCWSDKKNSILTLIWSRMKSKKTMEKDFTFWTDIYFFFLLLFTFSLKKSKS